MSRRSRVRRRLYIIAAMGVFMLVIALISSLYASYRVTRLEKTQLGLRQGVHSFIARELFSASGEVEKVRVELIPSCRELVMIDIIGIHGGHKAFNTTKPINITLEPLDTIILSIPRGCSAKLVATAVVVVMPYLWASILALILFIAGTVMLTFSVILIYVLP